MQRAVATPGLRRELQQTLKSWDTGSRVVLKADQEVAITDVQDSANEQRRGRIAEQGHSGERSSEKAGSDQNVKRCAGEMIEDEEQVKRNDIPLGGRVVSGIDHKIRAGKVRQNRVQRGSLTRCAFHGSRVWGEDHVHDFKAHEQECTES